MSTFRIVLTDPSGEIVEAMESGLSTVSDFTPLWSRLRKPWERSRGLMFATQGRSTGTPWPSYGDTPERDIYVWYKAGLLDMIITDPTDLDAYLLRYIKAPRLEPSLTNTRHSRAIWIEQPRGLTFGTAVSYAANHEYGIGKAPNKFGGYDIPRRRILSFGPHFSRDVGRQLTRFAGEVSRSLGTPSGQRVGLSSNRVRGLGGRGFARG